MGLRVLSEGIRDTPPAGDPRWSHPLLGPMYAAAEVLNEEGYWRRTEDLLDAIHRLEEALDLENWS